MRTIPRTTPVRMSRSRYQGVTVAPDQQADRDLGLSYWDDNAYAIIAKGYLPSGAEGRSMSQANEVQS